MLNSVMRPVCGLFLLCLPQRGKGGRDGVVYFSLFGDILMFLFLTVLCAKKRPIGVKTF